MSRRAHPLIKPTALRRTVAAGLGGAVLAAGGLLGAAPAAAAAEPLVISTAWSIVDAEPGQDVVIDPETMDFKLRRAVELAMPLRLGAAAEASERFLALGTIPLTTAEAGRSFFSGRDVAEAAEDRLARIGLPEDRVEAARWHFVNLVSLGNAITVRAEPAEEPPPSSEPAPPPTTQPPGTEPPTTEPPDTAPAAPPQAQTSAPGTSAAGTPPTTAQVPAASGALGGIVPDYTYVPGSLPPWAHAEFGQVPGSDPRVGDLLAESREQQRQQEQRQQEQREEVRAAGQAQAMPTEVAERVALPVLVAAVALAVATAALVRTWVLRRT
ncbi:hypothetical protein [Saccharopolyspora sp. CA-218241]|uniref:hypothetical protein n=1 Tax=Saccharopolyspora sp. CA-218241 TaxID=3240027 RepID=UPI003D965984